MNTQISNPSADDEATIRALYQQLIETPNVAKAYSCSSSALAGALSEYLPQLFLISLLVGETLNATPQQGQNTPS